LGERCEHESTYSGEKIPCTSSHPQSFNNIHGGSSCHFR
jgi:hypothetical protein